MQEIAVYELKEAHATREIAKAKMKEKREEMLQNMIRQINEAAEEGKSSVILKNMPETFADRLKKLGYRIGTRGNGFIISWRE